MKTSGQPSWGVYFRSLVGKLKSSENVALLCHQNADPDAVCSAFALETILRKLSPSVELGVYCPEGISASTRELLDNLGISAPSEKIPKKPDLAILVDTNTLDQLGSAGQDLAKSGSSIVVVDHHYPHPDTEKVASLMIVEVSAAAAAEVVYKLAMASKQKLDRLASMALLVALFVETKHFLLAGESTFQVAGALVGLGAEPRRIAEMLSSRMNKSERVARLKAAGRSHISMVGEWIVATSELGSYQSSGAKALLGLGAHLALVGGDVKDRVRVNMRATEEFVRKTGIHLGRDVAVPLGSVLGGTGGGHPAAAGLSANVSLDVTMKSCLERVKDLLAPFQT